MKRRPFMMGLPFSFVSASLVVKGSRLRDGSLKSFISDIVKRFMMSSHSSVSRYFPRSLWRLFVLILIMACVWVKDLNVGVEITQLPDSKVHGANMGPTWGRYDPGGPSVGPMNLAVWFLSVTLITISSLLLMRFSSFWVRHFYRNMTLWRFWCNAFLV